LAGFVIIKSMSDSKPRLYSLALLLVATLILSFLIFRPFLYALILATVFALVAQPLTRRLARGLGERAWLAAGLTIILMIIFVLTPLVVIGWQIFQESQQLYFSLSSGLVNGGGETFRQNWLATWPVLGNFSFDLEAYLAAGLRFLSQNLGAIFSSLAKFAVNAFVFLFALFYLLKDGEKIKRRFITLSPLTKADDEAIVVEVTQAINSVVKGSLTIAVIQGLTSFIGLLVFGVPNPVLWGVLAAIGALVPGVGTALVLLPAVLYLFLTGPLWPAAGLLVWGILAVGLIDNLLGPKLIGRGAKLHPLLTLLSVLGGLSLFGPIGFILGPVTVVFLLVLIEIIYATPFIK